MDMSFISCPFYNAALRLQKYEEKEADQALHFWHHYQKYHKAFFNIRNKVTPAFHDSSWHQDCVFMLWVASNETTIKHYSVELEFKCVQK